MPKRKSSTRKEVLLRLLRQNTRGKQDTVQSGASKGISSEEKRDLSAEESEWNLHQMFKKATHGLFCYEHAIKERRKSAERASIEKAHRHERGLIHEERRERGLCLWCGEKIVPGLQCCERHRQTFSEAGKRGRKRWTKEIDVSRRRKKISSENI